MINNKKTSPKKAFRLHAAKFFLTFSRVPTDKLLDFKEIKRRIIESQTIKNGIIAREKHEDGGIHFHIYLEYKNKKDIGRPDYFDFIFDHHGKYETCKSKVATIKYITKDMDYFLIGDLNSFSSGSLVEDFIRNKVKEGYGVEDFFYESNNRSIDSFIFDSGHKIARYSKNFQQHTRNLRLNRLKKIELFDLSKLANYSEKLLPDKKTLKDILGYLNDNVGKRKYKKPMLHLWSSEPNTGKTTIVHFLNRSSPSYIWPDDNWFDYYKNNTYQWILWDEFSPKGWDGFFLNRFLSGEDMRLPMKGSHTYKEDNPLIIMTSNQSLDQHCSDKWFNRESKQALFSKTLGVRVKEIELTQPLFHNFEEFERILNDITCYKGE